jgi:hypothetical protein
MMNFKIIFCLLFSISHVFSQDIYISNKVKVTFFSEARLANIEAVSLKESYAAINLHTQDIVFKIKIMSFSFHNKLMEDHFNENYMESDKFPYAILKGKINTEEDLTKEGSYAVTVDGTIDVHGVAMKRTFNGVIENKAGKLYMKAEFLLPVADHHIKIPNDKLSDISQNIKITVYAEFIPKK